MTERSGRDPAINPDHPDRSSQPGSGGLMPGNYEQAGGEAGRDAAEPPPAAGGAVPAPTPTREAGQ